MAYPDGATADILIVDDDEDALSALSLILEFKGYTVAIAANGKQALEYLEGHPAPRLMIVDLFMPVMDGWTLCEELKRRPNLAHLRVVVVTAFGRAVDVEADEILAKPLDVERLFSVMDRLMHVEGARN